MVKEKSIKRRQQRERKKQRELLAAQEAAAALAAARAARNERDRANYDPDKRRAKYQRAKNRKMGSAQFSPPRYSRAMRAFARSPFVESARQALANPEIRPEQLELITTIGELQREVHREEREEATMHRVNSQRDLTDSKRDLAAKIKQMDDHQTDAFTVAINVNNSNGETEDDAAAAADNDDDDDDDVKSASSKKPRPVKKKMSTTPAGPTPVLKSSTSISIVNNKTTTTTMKTAPSAASNGKTKTGELGSFEYHLFSCCSLCSCPN